MKRITGAASLNFSVIGLASIALAACAPSKEEAARLALACQIQDCVCESITLTALPQEVLWRQNGEAYCPQNYRLRATGKDD